MRLVVAPPFRSVFLLPRSLRTSAPAPALPPQAPTHHRIAGSSPACHLARFLCVCRACHGTRVCCRSRDTHWRFLPTTRTHARTVGEVWAVDEEMLAKLDVFEGCPIYYEVHMHPCIGQRLDSFSCQLITIITIITIITVIIPSAPRH